MDFTIEAIGAMYLNGCWGTWLRNSKTKAREMEKVERK